MTRALAHPDLPTICERCQREIPTDEAGYSDEMATPDLCSLCHDEHVDADERTLP